VTKEQVRTVILSFAIHAFIILFLIQHQFNTPSERPSHNKVIKSYLYVKPKVLNDNKQQPKVEKDNNLVNPTKVKLDAENKPNQNAFNMKKPNKSISPVLEKTAQLINKSNISTEKKNCEAKILLLKKVRPLLLVL